MKTSQATRKIKSIKAKYLFRYLFFTFLFLILTLFILTVYLTSQYLNLFYSGWILSNLSFLFSDNTKIQFIINGCFTVLVILLNVVFTLVTYYIINSKYQRKFLIILFDELKLNEIYLLEKRISNSNIILEQALKTLSLDNSSYEQLFNIKSLFTFGFVQFSKKNSRLAQGLLISSETDKLLNGYLEIRFDDIQNVIEYDNKGIHKFIVHKPDKYPYPLYINTNLGRFTSRIISDQVIKKIFELKRYTRTKYVLCIYNNKIFVYLDGWELRLTDSLRKKLTYNSIDKKIDSFTQLVDDLQDLYICILRNFEVIKYGK